MADSGCHICGDCWWVNCPNAADYTMLDVHAKRHGLPVYQGDIDLCAGHKEFAERFNRLDLNWDAIEQALTLQKVRS